MEMEAKLEEETEMDLVEKTDIQLAEETGMGRSETAELCRHWQKLPICPQRRPRSHLWRIQNADNPHWQ